MTKALLTIHQIRLKNARLLQEQAGGQMGMIEKTGRSQSQISQLMGENPSKDIGSNIARSLEKVFNKPQGWMDSPQWLETNERESLKKEVEQIPDHLLKKARELLRILQG